MKIETIGQSSSQWKRSLKVWFLTMLTGYILLISCVPSRLGLLPELRQYEDVLGLFVIILLLSLPALVLTEMVLRIVNVIWPRGRKALILFILTVLINALVYLMMSQILGFRSRDMLMLWPFSLSSFVLIFLVNIGWFRIQTSKRKKSLNVSQ